MSETKIYLELSNEIQELLADNDLSIKDILQREEIDAIVTQGIPPFQAEDGARTKDVITIVLAGSFAVAAISFAISQVLNTLHHKPYFVEYYENVELRDAKGSVLKDREGNPLFKTVKRHEILEPSKENQKKEFEAKFSLVNGIVIKFGSEEKK
jgi:hypothetical protein